jgi:hypothetical protein
LKAPPVQQKKTNNVTRLGKRRNRMAETPLGTLLSEISEFRKQPDGRLSTKADAFFRNPAPYVQEVFDCWEGRKHSNELSKKAAKAYSSWMCARNHDLIAQFEATPTALLVVIFRWKECAKARLSPEAYSLLITPTAEVQEVFDGWEGTKPLSGMSRKGREIYEDWLSLSK